MHDDRLAVSRSASMSAAKYVTAHRSHCRRRCYRSGLEIELFHRRADRAAGRALRTAASRATPASQALGNARARCQDLPHVCFVLGRVPEDWPTGRFDLILLSEVVYYLDRDDTRRPSGPLSPVAHRVLTAISNSCIGRSATDYPLSGDEAAELFIAALGDRAHLTLSGEPSTIGSICWWRTDRAVRMASRRCAARMCAGN